MESNLRRLGPKKKRPESTPDTPTKARPEPGRNEPDPWNSMTATEKLENLRNTMFLCLQSVDELNNQLDMHTRAINRMKKHLRAIIQIADNGEDLSSKVLKTTIEQSDVEELEEKLQNLLTTGLLREWDVVELEGFVVGRVEDENGEVINPRLQTVVKQIVGDDLEAVLGRKVGDKAKLEGGGFFVVERIFKMVEAISKPASSAEDSAIDEVIAQEEERFANGATPGRQGVGEEESEAPSAKAASTEQDQPSTNG